MASLQLKTIIAIAGVGVAAISAFTGHLATIYAVDTRVDSKIEQMATQIGHQITEIQKRMDRMDARSEKTNELLSQILLETRK